MKTRQLVDLNTVTTYIIRLILMELIFQGSQQVSLRNWKKKKKEKALPLERRNSSNCFANNIRDIISVTTFGLWYFQELSQGKSSAGMLICCFSDLLHMYHIIITTTCFPFHAVILTMGPMGNSSPDQIAGRKWIPVNEIKLKMDISKITVRQLFSKKCSFPITYYTR